MLAVIFIVSNDTCLRTTGSSFNVTVSLLRERERDLSGELKCDLNFLQKYVNESDLRLKKDDTLGVFVTEGDLHFIINEVDRGVAWSHLPAHRPLYVVINIDKQPTQISVTHMSSIMGK